MPSPPLDPDVADRAPDDPVLTAYDEQHVVTYLRLLDAEADHADWRDVAKIVLHIDPERYPERARSAFDSHLARAMDRIMAMAICCAAAPPIGRTKICRTKSEKKNFFTAENSRN